jgi:hypothetical protein
VFAHQLAVKIFSLGLLHDSLGWGAILGFI